MRFTPTKLQGAYLIDLDANSDARGFFARLFCAREFAGYGLPQQFVQISDSLNAKRHTLRGMHYQLAPHTETKMIRCLQGALLDIIIDLRPDSPTYKQWISEELSAENRRMMLIPKGFAHGFLTLEDNTELLYLMDEFYEPAAGGGVRWDDPEFGITLPHPPALLSEQDAGWKPFDPTHPLNF